MTNSYNLNEWRDERGRIHKQMQDLAGASLKESRAMTSEEDAKWNEMDARFNELGDLIQKAEKIDQRAKEFAETAEAQKPETKRDIDPRLAFRKLLAFGYDSLDKEERASLKVEKRGTSDQVTTTDGLGGYTVPEFWWNELIIYMTHYSGMMEASRILRTNSGGQLNFPYVNETSTTGSLISEGAAETVSDVTFATRQLDAYTYTSGLVKVSLELLNDSAYNLESELRDLLAARIGRSLNSAFTIDNGSSKPNGIANATSAGKTAAATNAVTRSEIIDLIHSVDRAYRSGPNVNLMMHDSTLAALKKLTVGSADDRPLWQPSIESGTPGTLEGYKIVVNNDVAELTDGASSKVMYFGDFSKYAIRLVNDFNMMTLRERFIDERCYGYMGFVRADGELLDTLALKHLVLAAS